MSFLGRCDVETVSCPGFQGYRFQGLSCSKVVGFEGGLFQIFSRATFFCFLGHLVGGYLFDLFALETNLKKKRSVTYGLIKMIGLEDHGQSRLNGMCKLHYICRFSTHCQMVLALFINYSFIHYIEWKCPITEMRVADSFVQSFALSNT